MTQSPDLLTAVLENARPRWSAWLRARYPALSNQHADIIQDAATDLSRYARARGRGPLSQIALSGVGFTILKRRVADYFRTPTARWALHSGELPLLPHPASEADLATIGSYTDVLRLTVGHIARMSPRDRDLLLHTEGSNARQSPMTAAERRQLSRLRQRLREEIARDHGIDIRKFLRESE